MEERKHIYIDDRVLHKVAEGREYCFTIEEAKRTEVILGRSCSVQDDVHIKNCTKDKIPILRRAGGGGTVVLTKGIIVISAAGISTLPFHLKEHMIVMNQSIIAALYKLGVRALSIEGISDIALKHRKLLGSSLYRRKDTVLYQGSLLVDPDMDCFARYLKHPQIEPAYRDRRSHGDFLTSLYQEGYRIEKEKLIECLKKKLDQGAPWAQL